MEILETIYIPALAGLVAALSLRLIDWCRLRYGRRKQIAYTRDLIKERREKIINTESKYDEKMKRNLSEWFIRKARYHVMIKRLAPVLDIQTGKLSLSQRAELLKALGLDDPDKILVGEDTTGPTIVDYPGDRWPQQVMRREDAVLIFKEIESITWLKLEPYAFDD